MPLEGVAAVSSKTPGLVDASQGVEEQAHTSKDCMEGHLQDTKTQEQAGNKNVSLNPWRFTL